MSSISSPLGVMDRKIHADGVMKRTSHSENVMDRASLTEGVSIILRLS
jgi:hypothetical protein